MQSVRDEKGSTGKKKDNTPLFSHKKRTIRQGLCRHPAKNLTVTRRLTGGDIQVASKPRTSLGQDNHRTE